MLVLRNTPSRALQYDINTIAQLFFSRITFVHKILIQDVEVTRKVIQNSVHNSGSTLRHWINPLLISQTVINVEKQLLTFKFSH